MKRMSRELIVGISAASLVAIALVGFFVLDTGSSSADVVLKDIPAEALEGAPFQLQTPGDAPETGITADEAKATAKTNGRADAPIREAVLARVSGGMPETDGRLMWVVNVEPTAEDAIPAYGGPVDPQESPFPWDPPLAHLIFIDAKTGEFLFGYQVAGPPDSSPESTDEKPTPEPVFTQVPGQ